MPNTAFTKLKVPLLNLSIGGGLTPKGNERHPQQDWLEEFFDVVINVSDSPCFSFTLQAPRAYWFPIDELGDWGYASLHAVKRALDWHAKQKDRIYLHCHSGVGRAPLVAYLYLRSKGLTAPQAEQLFSQPRPLQKRLEREQKRGYIPRDIIKFLKIAEENPGWSAMGCRQALHA